MGRKATLQNCIHDPSELYTRQRQKRGQKPRRDKAFQTCLEKCKVLKVIKVLKQQAAPTLQRGGIAYIMTPKQETALFYRLNFNVKLWS